MNAITGIANSLLNTFWQAAALTFLVWLGMRLSPPRLNAATRHIVWWIALAAIFFLACIPRSVPSTPASRPAPPPSASPAPVRVAPPLTLPEAGAVVTVTETRSAVWPFLFAAIWAAFGFGGITRIIRSYYRLRRMKRRALVWNRPLPGLTRPVRVLISPEISSPVAVGFLHPAIMLPENLRGQLTAAEMDLILLHESAHLVRRDDWENLIAQLVGAVANLHPVAWWILRQTRREREMACDEWVVARTGAALPYADCLMRLLERRLAPEHSVLATGIFTRRSQLRTRIEMLLRRGHEFTTAAARIPLGVAVVALAGLVMAGALTPNWVAFAQQPGFEVASVKRSDPKRGGLGKNFSCDSRRCSAEGVSLSALAWEAYGLKEYYQMEAASQWMSLEHYDIAATVPDGTTIEQAHVMLQRLLTERLGLVVHRETRQLPGYRLVVAKGGPKLRRSVDAPTIGVFGESIVTKNGVRQFADNARSGRLLTIEEEQLHGRKETIGGLAHYLVQALHTPVIDATGIEGEYDYDLSFEPIVAPLQKGSAIVFSPGAGAPAGAAGPPSAPAPSDHPTVFTAIKELGLELESVKSVPVEVLVLDKANRDPTAN